MHALRSILLALLALGSAPAPADTSDAEIAALRQALEQVEKGPLSAWPAIERQYRGHALKPWLDYAALRRRLDSASDAEVRDFLDRNAGLPFLTALRVAWLRTRIEQKDWDGFLAFHQGEDSPELRCAALVARLDDGADAADLQAVAQVWLSPESLPALCDAPFAALDRSGGITPALAMERIGRALDAGNASLARYVARRLDPEGRAQVEAYADFLVAPDARAARWPAEALAQRVAAHGLLRLARRDPGQAETLLADLSGPLDLDAAVQDSVRYAIALWSAASYLPESAARFKRVPERAWDDRLHEWRAREAMARADWRAARAAILAMPDTLAQATRWRYFRARVEELLGLRSEARQLLADVAGESNYHGFLAADRLGWPYALCPRELDEDPERRARVAALPGMQRALLLHRTGRQSWARMEWAELDPALRPDERREAVRLAAEIGWHDRAVFSLTSGTDLQHYGLRFPLSYRRSLLRQAEERGLDAGWVAALIRAESAWMPDARSAADARGLMQILPGTGAEVARKLGIAWAGSQTLYRPAVNLRIGSAYLGAMRDRFDGNMALATAAYNAGPGPVLRWRGQRATDPMDIWIETIPYGETREYVARVLAFSVIYDWRLQGKARSLSARLGQGEGSETRSFACPS